MRNPTRLLEEIAARFIAEQVPAWMEAEIRADAKRGRKATEGGDTGKYLGRRHAPPFVVSLHKMANSFRKAVKWYGAASEEYGEPIDKPAERALLLALDAYTAQLQAQMPKPAPKVPKRRGRPPAQQAATDLLREMAAALVKESGFTPSHAKDRARQFSEATGLIAKRLSR